MGALSLWMLGSHRSWVGMGSWLDPAVLEPRCGQLFCGRRFDCLGAAVPRGDPLSRRDPDRISRRGLVAVLQHWRVRRLLSRRESYLRGAALEYGVRQSQVLLDGQRP